MDDKDPQRSVRVLTLWLIFLSVVIGITTNVATGILPESFKPYLWLSWPILGLLIALYLYLNWHSTTNQEDGAVSQRVKLLAKKAIDDAKSKPMFSLVLNGPQKISAGVILRLIAWRILSLPVWIISIPDKIDYELHLMRVTRKIRALEATTREYAEAVAYIEKARDNGKLPDGIAEKAIAGLEADFHHAMEQLAPTPKKQE